MVRNHCLTASSFCISAAPGCGSHSASVTSLWHELQLRIYHSLIFLRLVFFLQIRITLVIALSILTTIADWLQVVRWWKVWLALWGSHLRREIGFYPCSRYSHWSSSSKSELFPNRLFDILTVESKLTLEHRFVFHWSTTILGQSNLCLLWLSSMHGNRGASHSRIKLPRVKVLFLGGSWESHHFRVLSDRGIYLHVILVSIVRDRRTLCEVSLILYRMTWQVNYHSLLSKQTLIELLASIL